MRLSFPQMDSQLVPLRCASGGCYTVDPLARRARGTGFP
jgi:hypothetical protein